MRLLFVTQDFPPDVGGIQTYSWELTTRLASKTSSLEVVAPRRPNASAVDREVPFVVTRAAGRPDLLPITGVPAVIRRARKMQAEVAFHAQWQTVVTSVLARWITGWPRRIACAAHGRELLFNPASSVPGLSNGYEALRKAAVSEVDAFFPVSHYTADLLHDLGVSRERLHVVPNGTDPDHFRPHNSTSVRDRLGLGDRPVLLTVGRLVRRKGVDTVLRALRQIASSLSDVQYVVVGTGPDRNRLEALATQLGVRERIHFVGRVSHEDLPLFYSTADLFVMPAREDPPDVEGFGLVFLEANACGTPVVGARTGGIPDAIVEGETGLLIPPSAPEKLAQSVLDLFSNPDQLLALGKQGRKRVLRTSSWDHVAEDLFSHLSSLQ